MQTLFNIEEFKAPVKADWCADDWETPNEVARFIGSLVEESDRVIIEPSAGTGKIAQHLPHGATCIELSPIRHLAGSVPTQNWLCDDFLRYAASREAIAPNLIIGNPPFSLGMEFLAASQELLAPKGRILFLLPTEYFQACSRAKALAETGLVISKQWAIAGRVGFLKQGKAHKNRQCYDSVFELRRAADAQATIQIVDPYSRVGGSAIT